MPLTCWFHVTKAAREWFIKWCRLRGPEASHLWTGVVLPDLTTCHLSLSEAEFRSRADAVLEEWARSGIAGSTRHSDKSGQVWDLKKYMQNYWIKDNSAWHCGMLPRKRIPATSNACESSIGKTRTEAGSVEAGALPLTKFMLAQVQFFAKRKWEPQASVKTPVAVWRRAVHFRDLLDTPKVAKRASVWSRRCQTTWSVVNGRLVQACRLISDVALFRGVAEAIVKVRISVLDQPDDLYDDTCVSDEDVGLSPPLEPDDPDFWA